MTASISPTLRKRQLPRALRLAVNMTISLYVTACTRHAIHRLEFPRRFDRTKQTPSHFAVIDRLGYDYLGT